MPHLGKNRNYKSTPGHPNSGRVANPRATGYGIIQPGAHPEFESRATPFEKLTKVAGRFGRKVEQVLNRMNSSGSYRSPSTKKDQH